MTRRQSAFMQRGSWVLPNRGRLSISSRRKLVAHQATLDNTIFDSSLGCPLGSYEDATLALVGGKALQCWRLMKHGLDVPPAFIVPTYVYSMHIHNAGVVELIEEVFSSNLLDEYIRKETESKLSEIRKRIMNTPLNNDVVGNLETFLDSLGQGTTVAVRSSGTAEDLSSQSFAGQYDTFLYKSTTQDVCESIKACWASMFKPHILNYVKRPSDLDLKGEPLTNEPSTYRLGKMKPPQMGVLVMKMVEATAAGVCVSQNLWGSVDEVMIEAVYGQGEGLVGGEITPDRYVFNKLSKKLVYQQLHKQTHKFIRSENMNGVDKVELKDDVDVPVLSNSQLLEIVSAARAVEEYYNRPQDIEWALDANGKIKIIQARPITTLDNNLSFLPPGEGLWTYDPVHFPRPFSPWMQDTYSFAYCDERGKRTGCLMKTVEFRFVHEFAFTQPVMRPPSDALERAAEAYWTKRQYEDDYREFRDFFIPECKALHDELLAVNPSSLSHRELVKHVARCFDLSTEFWKLHHSYSIPATVVVGDFMIRMGELMNKDPMETLVLLESASPESRGLLNRNDPLLANMYELLLESQAAMALLQVDESKASWAVDCLLHLPGELGEVMREVMLRYGWRLAGYDLVNPAIIETPSFFLKTLYSGTQEDPNAFQNAGARVLETAKKWKESLPLDKHDEFDAVLDLGRRFFRIRDERGLWTDLSGVGLCRRGLLEAGRRLVEHSIIYKAEHLCVTRKHEAIALLGGDLGCLSSQQSRVTVGPVDVPTPRELERRYSYICQAADPSTIPRALGVSPPEPIVAQLPPNIRRTMEAVAVGMKGVWDEGQGGNTENDDIENNPDVVKGLAASTGVVKGSCCLVLNDGDLQKVKKGDVIVTFSCSASFNCVLGLCAGICTDYGGMLSHAAIVAREYGIPAVVGTQSATNKFRDGDTIRVDCGTAKVQRISRA